MQNLCSKTILLTDNDLHLIREGKHYEIYNKLGAHLIEYNGIKGTSFAVWAPFAQAVSVVGDFNGWDASAHPMCFREYTGIWELFIPEVLENRLYKYELCSSTGETLLKSDPYAFYSAKCPNIASVVYNLEAYHWNDLHWMEDRSAFLSHNNPISVYEVHMGSWSSASPDGHIPLSYRQHANQLVNYVKNMGFTHVELMPMMEHPFDGSWGYQITGYYSVTNRFGKPEDFMYFVDRCHQEGIGVILDWVPAHFAKDSYGLGRFDGTPLYEYEDSTLGEHPQWGTYVFDLGRKEVRNFLIGNALFWLEKYHIDGLRVDAVSCMLYLDYSKNYGEWTPTSSKNAVNPDSVEFLRQLNTAVHTSYPGTLMIAEESSACSRVTGTCSETCLGFTFKWNMGWMNDSLKYMQLEPAYRKLQHHLITFSMHYHYSEDFMLVLSHDEVVHGKHSMICKMPGDYYQKFSGLRSTYGFMFGHPGKKLLFMGNEFGQIIEWNHCQSLDWHLLNQDMHQKLNKYVRDLNHLYQSEKALYELDSDPYGFEWMDCNNSDTSVLSFLRRGRSSQDVLLFVCNFSNITYYDYLIGVPFYLPYREILNSDSEIYGGSNIGNFGMSKAVECPYNNKPYSLKLIIPALSTLVFKPEL